MLQLVDRNPSLMQCYAAAGMFVITSACASDRVHPPIVMYCLPTSPSTPPPVSSHSQQQHLSNSQQQPQHQRSHTLTDQE